jgi:hypothetical protein
MRPPEVVPPSRDDLAWLAQRLRLARLVWLWLGPRGEATVIVYDREREPQIRTLTRMVAMEQVLRNTARVISNALGGVPARPMVEPTSAPTKPTTTIRKPWYRKWWVWTIAGVVVAGAAVGVGVALSREEQGKYDFRFHF